MIETIKAPETETEVLCEWFKDGTTAYRITVVGGVIRLETAPNSHHRPLNWVMCAIEGKEVFDALLIGVSQLRKKLGQASKQNLFMLKVLQRVSSAITDPDLRSEIRMALPEASQFERGLN